MSAASWGAWADRDAAAEDVRGGGAQRWVSAAGGGGGWSWYPTSVSGWAQGSVGDGRDRRWGAWESAGHAASPSPSRVGRWGSGADDWDWWEDAAPSASSGGGGRRAGGEGAAGGGRHWASATTYAPPRPTGPPYAAGGEDDAFAAASGAPALPPRPARRSDDGREADRPTGRAAGRVSVPTGAPPTAASAAAAGVASRGLQAPSQQGRSRGPLQGAAEPHLVTLGLTVQGPQQGLAMVTGHKQIENRGWRIPVGWYALHVGSQPLAAIGQEWCDRMRVAWPDVPPERSLPSSSLVGLIHICEHRSPEECPSEGHPQAVWAVGPVCHVIDEVVALPRAIRHRGSPGLWEISPVAREQLLRQLANLSPQVLPPLPWGGGGARELGGEASRGMGRGRKGH